MTTSFIRLVFAVVLQVANQFFVHAVMIGASELIVGIARLGSFSAKGHVILVRSVLAVVVAVAYLPTQNTAAVVALEVIAAAAFIRAFFLFLIRIVIAIIDTIAAILNVNTDGIFTFKSFRWTVFSI